MGLGFERMDKQDIIIALASVKIEVTRHEAGQNTN